MTTISIILILLFCAQSIFWTGFAKFSHKKSYDNNSPRLFLDNLSGKAQRSYWSHINSNEAFPLFLAAIICANISQVNSLYIHIIGSIIIMARILYGVLYIQDKATLRSLVWFIGYGLSFLLLILCVI